MNIDHLKTDTDLDQLHNDKKWTVLVNKMQNKIDSVEANYDKPLQKELLQIWEDDQGKPSTVGKRLMSATRAMIVAAWTTPMPYALDRIR